MTRKPINLDTVSTLLKLQEQDVDPDLHNRIAQLFRQTHYRNLQTRASPCSNGPYCALFQMGAYLSLHLQVPHAKSLCGLSHSYAVTKGESNERHTARIEAYRALFRKSVEEYVFNLRASRFITYDPSSRELSAAIHSDIRSYFSPVFVNGTGYPNRSGYGDNEFPTPALDRYVDTHNSGGTTEFAREALIARLAKNMGVSAESARELLRETPDYRQIKVIDKHTWEQLPNMQTNNAETVAINASLVTCIDYLYRFIERTLNAPPGAVARLRQESGYQIATVFDAIKSNQQAISNLVNFLYRERGNNVRIDPAGVQQRLQDLIAAEPLQDSVKELGSNVIAILKSMRYDDGSIIEPSSSAIKVRTGGQLIVYPHMERAVFAGKFSAFNLTQSLGYDAELYEKMFAKSNFRLFSSYLNRIAFKDDALSAYILTLLGIVSKLKGIKTEIGSPMINNYSSGKEHQNDQHHVHDAITAYRESSASRIAYLESKRAEITSIAGAAIGARSKINSALLIKALTDDDEIYWTRAFVEALGWKADSNGTLVLDDLVVSMRGRTPQIAALLRSLIAVREYNNQIDIPIYNMSFPMFVRYCFEDVYNVDDDNVLSEQSRAVMPLWNAFRSLVGHLVDV